MQRVRKNLIQEICLVIRMSDSWPVADKKSYSQFSQDTKVVEFYNGKKNGFFVEIGAHNGITCSNGYLLERKYQWKGICAEPNPKLYKTLVLNRPGSICTDKAVYHTSGCTVEFDIANSCDALSGIASTLDRHKAYVDLNKTTISVTTISLADLLKEHKAPAFIEYLSLDTEGSEYDILRTFPFEEYRFGLIHLEHNYVEPRRQQIRDLLISNGYVFSGENNVDDCYQHSSLIKRATSVEMLSLPSREETDILVVPILIVDECRSVAQSLKSLREQTINPAKLHLYFITSKFTTECEAFQREHGLLYASIHIVPLDTSPQYFVYCAVRLGAHLLTSQGRYVLEPYVFETLLKSKDKGVIAPMLTSNTRYSNYHIKVDANGYCLDDPLYDDLLYKRVKGQIAVPVVNGIYFVNNAFLKYISYTDVTKRDSYVIMSDGLRKKGISQYLDNRQGYGIII